MTKQIGVPELFAFLDEVRNDYLCACVMKSIVSSFPLNDASVQDALSNPVIPQPDVGDSDEEIVVREEESEEVADFFDEIQKERFDGDKNGFIKVKFLPWNERFYAQDTIVRLSSVASILTKFFEIPPKLQRQKIGQLENAKYTYVLAQWKRKYPGLVKDISERADKFQFDFSAKYRGVLAFLFRFFVSVLVSKMRTAGDSQSASLKGKAYICPGSLHVNGGENETTEGAGMFLHVNGDRSVLFSVEEIEAPAKNDFPKEMWIPFLPLWLLKS